MSDQRKKDENEKQVRGFIEAAKALGCDESEENFERRLKKISSARPPSKRSPKTSK